MTATDTSVETTRIEITRGQVSAWSLLVRLAQAAGLDDGLPATGEGHELREMAVTGTSWAGAPARLEVSRTLLGHVVATLTVEAAEEEARAGLHDAVLESAAAWLDDLDGVRWRWSSTACADGAWHCGWRLAAAHHPAPVMPVTAWRRGLALAIDWPASLASYALGGLAWVGLLLHLLGSRSGLHPGRLADLLWQAGTPGHAAALLAGAVLARRVAAVAVDMLAPDGVAPRWWVHAWHHVQDCATVVLLAAVVVVLGGGWLS
jgi:hypothetical protein